MASDSDDRGTDPPPNRRAKKRLRPLPEDLRDAVSAVLKRLAHLKVNWNDALSNYFEFAGFLISLQNSIATARTVTFILQSHKSAIPDFDSWYEPFRAKFDQDPIMTWAKLARNKIEKQGDLEILSQVRAELVAAYTHNPKTPWLSPNVAWSGEQFRRSIPSGLLDEHVIENGAIAIERRWVDVELPEHEVLDALAHVYGQLALMVVSLHQHCQIVIPDHSPEMGEHLIRNLLPDGRVPSMERPFGDRGIYIAVKDGSILGHRREFRSIERKSLEKASKRYGDRSNWDGLAAAKSLRDVAEIYFKNARTVMLKDGYHASMFVLLKGNMPIDLIVAAPRHRIDKYLLMRDIAHVVFRSGADGLIQISEAWTAPREQIPKGKFAVDAPNRGETIMLAAVNSSGEMINLSAEVVRKRFRRHKVKELLPTEVEVGSRMVGMAPVLEKWNRLDALRLEEDDEALRWLEDHFRLPSASSGRT